MDELNILSDDTYELIKYKKDISWKNEVLDKNVPQMI